MIWFSKSQKDQIAAINELADKYAKKMESAIVDAIDTLSEEANISVISGHIENSNFIAVEDMANQLGDYLVGAGIAGAYYKEYFISALDEGGELAIASMPTKASINATFDVVNPLVSEWINKYIPTNIKEITDTTRDAITSTLRQGTSNGDTPQTMARYIKDTIGLTGAQAKAVINYRKQLEAKSNLYGMTPAQQRLIGIRDQQIIGRHLREGHLTKDKIDEMVTRYRKNLVKLRAETIARTESFRAVNEGRHLAWKKSVSDGLIKEGDIVRKWVTARDDRVRPNHAAIPRMNKDGVGINEPFNTPTGKIMNPPYGVNCRCAVVTKIK